VHVDAGIQRAKWYLGTGGKTSLQRRGEGRVQRLLSLSPSFWLAFVSPCLRGGLCYCYCYCCCYCCLPPTAALGTAG
jgi:hypothetical protein